MTNAILQTAKLLRRAERRYYATVTHRPPGNPYVLGPARRWHLRHERPALAACHRLARRKAILEGLLPW
jgi:hypothetical protein